MAERDFRAWADTGWGTFPRASRGLPLGLACPPPSYLEEVFVHNLQAAATAHTLAWRADGARGHGLWRRRRGKRGRGGAGVLVPSSLRIHLQEEGGTGRRPLLPSTSHHPTGAPQGLSSRPSFPCPLPGVPRPARPPAAPRPAPPKELGVPPAGLRPTHQSCVLPGAFAGPPGRQGCRPPALLRHEPRALRRDSGEGGETRVRSRRRAHGAPQPPRPRRALEGPARGRRVQPPRAPEPGRSWRASAQPPWAAAASGRLQDCGAVARGPALTPARRLPAPRRGYPANNRPPRTKRLLSRRQSPGSGEHPAKGGAGRGEVE